MTADGLPPCRLRFAFAADAPVGVILRRGPSRWVQMVRWDLASDTFALGQWLRGHVPTFDVSPDGAHVLAYVAPHARPAPNTWVALSKPPWWTALAVWPMPDGRDPDCAFVDRRTIAIRPGTSGRRPELAPGFHLERYSLADPPYRWDWDWRMTRDGWTAAVPPDYPERWGWHSMEWSKPSPRGPETLHFQNHRAGGSDYWLETPAGRVPVAGVAQADWDPRGRLVAVAAGALVVVDPRTGETAQTLADLNRQSPENTLPPPEATRW